MNINDTKYYIDSESFMNLILDGSQNEKKYCFIIGSGMSVSSGIKTGCDMLNEWFDQLKDGKDQDSYKKDILRRINIITEKYKDKPDIDINSIKTKLMTYTDINYKPDIKSGQEDYYFIYELR